MQKNLETLTTGPDLTEARFLKFLVGALLVFEALSAAGLCVAPHETLMLMAPVNREGWVNLAGAVGLLSFAYIFSDIRRSELCLFLITIFVATCVVEMAYGDLLWPANDLPKVPLGIGGIFALAHLGLLASGRPPRKAWSRRLLTGYGIYVLFGFIAPSYLTLTSSLNPSTHDLQLLHLDAAFGFSPSLVVASWAHSTPALYQLLDLAYHTLPAALLVLYVIQLRRAFASGVNIINLVIMSAIGVFLAYNLYPVAGPKYVFGSDYPGAMPSLKDIPALETVVPPKPRNGMPSMHFGWALAIWLLAMRESLMAGIISFGFVVLVGLSTLALGEHYFIDLVVAGPFVLLILALASERLPWAGVRRNAMLWGGALYIGWLLILWFGIPLLLARPSLLWAASCASIGICGYQFFILHRASVGGRETVLRTATVLAPPQREFASRQIHALFFLSGIAALMYQVLFAKQLTFVFGSMSTATNTVLTTFMAGMAVGAWAGGALAQRLSRPILVYAICECAIAIYCAASPLIFNFVRYSYVTLASGMEPDAAVLLPLRVVLGGAALIFPTVLMGMTLPILARFFEHRRRNLGSSVGRLYAANTLGAAIGALLAGYLIIPAVGLHNANLLAVVVNLAVTYLALRLQRTAGAVPSLSVANDCGSAAIATKIERRRGWVAIVLLTVGGFITLALEVEYVYLLAIAAGNSTYAFSLMLFAFLIGLAGGAELGRVLIRKFELSRLLVSLEIALAIIILGSILKVEGLPAYFGSYAGYTALSFAAHESIRGLACCLVMIPPALLIGAIFTVAVECVGRGFPQSSIRMLGVTAGLNTAGNIAGVLVAGFFLLPAVGALHSVELLAAICLLLAVLSSLATDRFWRWSTVIPFAATFGFFALLPERLDYDALTSGANVYFRAQPWGHVIDHAESLDGGLTSINENPSDIPGQPTLTLLTNGKFQGTNSRAGEMIAQTAFALAPLMHVDHRDAALVVGYGTGNTSRILHAAGFRRLDIADISADIYRLSNQYLADVNDRVSEKANVNAYVTDGRNYLLLTTQEYDLISMEITSIWFAGAASLYNSDYYRLAKAHLKKGGVLQQWVQLHHASTQDIFYVLGTLRSEFRYIWFYFVGGQGIAVASNDPEAFPDERQTDALHSSPELQKIVDLRGGSAEFKKTLLLGPDDVDHLLSSTGIPPSFFVSTDDNSHLEYSTPKGNVFDGGQSMEKNLEALKQYSSHPGR